MPSCTVVFAILSPKVITLGLFSASSHLLLLSIKANLHKRYFEVLEYYHYYYIAFLTLMADAQVNLHALYFY